MLESTKLVRDGVDESYDKPSDWSHVQPAEPIEEEATDGSDLRRADEPPPQMGQGETAANAITSYWGTQ